MSANYIFVGCKWNSSLTLIKRLLEQFFFYLDVVGERTSKKSDSSTSSPGQAAGNGSKSGGSTPRSSSSGSDKPSTNPNYTSTALQEVEIHPYMDLHTRGMFSSPHLYPPRELFVLH